jgi:hypothetical protein
MRGRGGVGNVRPGAGQRRHKVRPDSVTESRQETRAPAPATACTHRCCKKPPRTGPASRADLRLRDRQRAKCEGGCPLGACCILTHRALKYPTASLGCARKSSPSCSSSTGSAGRARRMGPAASAMSHLREGRKGAKRESADDGTRSTEVRSPRRRRSRGWGGHERPYKSGNDAANEEEE